jgi:type I restriction enzyme S subunit
MSEWKETDIGTIPFDWDILPLTKLIEFTVDNRGKTVPIVDEETNYALIATNCIKESALFPVKENLRFLTEETYQNWFRSHPLPGDIIIVNKGTPGLVCMTPDPVDFCIAQDMIALRVNEKVYNNYLFAYMRTEFFKYQVRSLNVGTTIPHLKKTNFKELKILIPPLREQKMIGDLYYRLSYKIENLRRQNETLEAIAQTLFKHWFVDFEFPNADGKPYKSSGGEMERSELGEIPADWRIGGVIKLWIRT